MTSSTARLSASSVEEDERFGFHVAIAGGVIVAGTDTWISGSGYGSAYVFASSLG